MDKAWLSIITPVYNNSAEQLNRCVCSVASQVDEGIELIIVDDGSCVSVGEYCDSLAKSFDFVKVIHQDNQGASAARNRGLEAASGDFVTFLDADDYVSERFLRVVRLASSQADILIFDLLVEVAPGVLVPNHCFKSDRLFSRDNFGQLYSSAVSFLLPINGYAPKYHGVGTVAGKVYRRGLLVENNVWFRTDLTISEDAVFFIDALAFSKMVEYRSDPLYVYCMNSDSVTRSVSGSFIESCDAYLKAFEERAELFDDELCRRALAVRSINSAIQICDLVVCAKNPTRDIADFYSSYVFDSMRNLDTHELKLGIAQIVFCILTKRKSRYLLAGYFFVLRLIRQAAMK